jgi:methionine-S-sulfoxide reductase
MSDNTNERATFGAGCFWQVEEAFRELPGVIDTAVGYEGGHVDNPTYEQVCTGTTGHTEVAEVTFDPERTSFDELVAKYLAIHDPTQLNRQGPDVGFQYRSVIFSHSDEQTEAVRKAIESAQASFRDPIMTTIEPAATFWRAEDYHQCYLQKRSERGGVFGMLMGR